MSTDENHVNPLETEPRVAELLGLMQDGYEAEVQGICRELALTVQALLAIDSGVDWSKVSDEARQRVFELQAYLVADGYLAVAADHAKAA